MIFAFNYNQIYIKVFEQAIKVAAGLLAALNCFCEFYVD